MNTLQKALVCVATIVITCDICLGQVTAGVVVEKVASNSEAQKAGIQPRGVLLSWVRGDQKGSIDSPFDLSLIEMEQAPREL